MTTLSCRFPSIISYCALHHIRFQTALCLPSSLINVLRPIKLAESIVIKDLLDNQFSMRPLHSEFRIASKSGHTAALLAPCSRVLLEKLTFCHLVKKFPAFYGTRRLITALTSARQLYLTWARSVQHTPCHCRCCISIVVLSPIYSWVLEVASFPLAFPTKASTRLSSPPHVLHAPPISFSIWSPDHPNVMYRPLSSSLCIFLHHNVVSPLLGTNKFVPKYSHCSTLSNKLHPIFILCLGPAFWSPDMTCTEFYQHLLPV